MEALLWVLGIVTAVLVVGFGITGIAALFVLTGAPQDTYDVEIKGNIDRKNNVDAKK